MRRSNSHRKKTSRIPIDPFHPEPDKRFYYAFEAFEQRLAILRRLIQGSDALIFVIGERGSGKSTLLQRILATTDLPWKPCRVQTAKSAAGGRRPRLKQKGSPAAFLLQDPGATIVLMDDAHRLSRKELRKLLQDTLTEGPARKFKRMVLFGRPRVGENFDAVSGGLIEENAVNKIFLPTITVEEAAAFIRHRLAVAGYTGKNPFTPTVLKNLYDGSAGLPGRINKGAARLWAKHGFYGNVLGENSRHNQSRLLRAVGWFAATLAAVLLAGVLWISAVNDRSPGLAPASGQQVVRVKIQSVEGQLRPRADIASVSPGRGSQPGGSKTARPVVSAVTQNRPAPDSTHSKPSPATAAPSRQPDKDRPGDIRREQWLLAQNAADYTIQLLGVRSEQSLLAFVADHRLDRGGQAAYYRSRFRGGIWFPLVYGTYPSVEEARRAIAGLPEKVRDMSPWIRKMSAVHAEIRKAAKP
ncbi:MAG: hypothetical protein AMJ54_09905 [Deltaproteobacteria bacterium SG8_13]|nr:MAG: hypothetical protein AMJ54_09905 [Deltaproteobacteria bacterium SG8_13]